MTLKEYAKSLGISYNALYKKTSKQDGFSVDEVKKTVICLSLSYEDVLAIFFNDVFPLVNKEGKNESN